MRPCLLLPGSEGPLSTCLTARGDQGKQGTHLFLMGSQHWVRRTTLYVSKELPDRRPPYSALPKPGPCVRVCHLWATSKHACNSPSSPNETEPIPPPLESGLVSGLFLANGTFSSWCSHTGAFRVLFWDAEPPRNKPRLPCRVMRP